VITNAQDITDRGQVVAQGCETSDPRSKLALLVIRTRRPPGAATEPPPPPTPQRRHRPEGPSGRTCATSAIRPLTPVG
jgi:hypothetical protein